MEPPPRRRSPRWVTRWSSSRTRIGTASPCSRSAPARNCSRRRSCRPNYPMAVRTRACWPPTDPMTASGSSSQPSPSIVTGSGRPTRRGCNSQLEDGARSEAQHECGAFLERPYVPHAAAHAKHELADHGEPDAVAALAGTEERQEDLPFETGWHARTVVAHDDLQAAA